MNTELMFSSKSPEWETPDWLFNQLHEEFGFTLDVCANTHNYKIKPYISENSLEREWTGVCWMNPPYGREIIKWVEKAYRSAENGATVVCLLPARTDTRWWHDYCMHGEIRLIRGRLKFGNQKNSAPFPSAIVVFGPGVTPRVIAHRISA